MTPDDQPEECPLSQLLKLGEDEKGKRDKERSNCQSDRGGDLSEAPALASGGRKERADGLTYKTGTDSRTSRRHLWLSEAGMGGRAT